MRIPILFPSRGTIACKLASELASHISGANMRIIHELDEMTEVARGWIMGGAVGFVPTMGNLHNGHLTLIRAAHKECEMSVVSIFVNALQFPSLSAAQHYPHTIQRDLQLLRTTDVDVVFLPSHEAVYPPTFSTYITPIGSLAERIASERGIEFVRGFSTGIMKFLQIVRPDVAFFGQNEVQQVALVRQLVRDLSVDVTLRILPIVREHDGLAASSLNIRLSREQRHAATSLYKALLAGKTLIEQGERQPTVIKQAIQAVLAAQPQLSLPNICLCHPDTFQEMEEATPGMLLRISAQIEDIHLTDNIVWMANGQWRT